MKTITLRLSDNLHKAFKMYALEHDLTMQDILLWKLEELLDWSFENDRIKTDEEKMDSEKSALEIFNALKKAENKK